MALTFEEQYRIVTERAALGTIAPRWPIAVRGRDRASYLQGLLTNDIASLTTGTGCYSAWLTPQGRMLTDMFVLELGDQILLDVPAAVAAETLGRLDDYRFSEDVRVSNLAPELSTVWVHGPEAAGALRRVLPSASGIDEWPAYRSATFEIGGAPVLVMRADQTGAPGYGLYVAPPQRAGVEQSLAAVGVLPMGPEALDAARIEAGYPIFGVDMTTETIPLEAGIEDRAISATKGCYVGQEVIVRVLHRGHGRVARKLVGLRVDGDVPQRSARLFADERDVGWITSAARSPRLGSIALGYVHRDLATPGAAVSVETTSGRAAATVASLPFVRSVRL